MTIAAEKRQTANCFRWLPVDIDWNLKAPHPTPPLARGGNNLHFVLNKHEYQGVSSSPGKGRLGGVLLFIY